MMHTVEVTKDLVFRMRLDSHDRERLDKLAEHFSAPAATVVRILIKEKSDDLRRREADLAQVAPMYAKKMARQGQLAETKAYTSVSLACPKYFRIAITEAKAPGGSYAHAGYVLASHLDDLAETSTVEGEASEAETALLAARNDTVPAQAVFEWMRTYLPRCYALVPPNRAPTFIKGIGRALDEDR